MTRKRLSTRTRLEVFRDHGGVCHLCLGKIQAGEAWDLSHDRPLALLGADDASNWAVAHRKCHRAHTAAIDVPNIARAKRREAVFVGAKAPSARPIRSRGFEQQPRRLKRCVAELARMEQSR